MVGLGVPDPIAARRALRTVVPRLIGVVFAIGLSISVSAADRASDAQGVSAQSGQADPTGDLLAQSGALSEQALVLYKQGRYADAEPLLKQALAIQKAALGPDDPDIAPVMNNLAGIYRELGRYADAEALYRQALEIREKLLGRNDSALASSLNNLAAVLSNQGRYSDAEPLFRRAISLKEKASGQDDPDVARTLNNLAQLYRLQGLYAQAELLCKRALATLKKALGPDHPDVATGLNNLAQVYWAQARYGEAEPLFKRALEIREKTFGSEHPVVAVSLNGLAELYRVQGRYAEAGALYRRALAIREKALGPDHPDVGTSLHDMAALEQAQGHYGEAEPLYRRSLAIREKALGPEHPDVALTLSKQAALYREEGRDGEAESLYVRALAIREKAFGADHPDVGESSKDLAFLYEEQGRYDKAEPLLRRALAIAQKALGPENADLAASLNDLAVLLSYENRYVEAEGLSRRALALQEKTLGRDHPDVARTLNNLAVINRVQGRNGAAEPLYRRALAIRERTLGLDHPDVAASLTNLATLAAAQGHYEEAERLLQRALEVRRKSLGPEDPAVADDLNSLAELYRAENRMEPALAASAQCMQALEKQLRSGLFEISRGGLAERRRYRAYIANYIRIAYLAAAAAPHQSAMAGAQTLRIVQIAQAASAAPALGAAAANLAAGDDALAAAARERADLIGRRQWLAEILRRAGRSPGGRKPEQQEATQASVRDADQQLRELDAKIAREFPAYAELTNPQPVSNETARALLRDDEALLIYLSVADETWLWVVRGQGIALYRLGIGAAALADEVAALRSRLDPRHNPHLEPYPASRAHRLYEKILAPAGPLLTGVDHLLIVPDGPLLGLPPSVLVTKLPQADPDNFEEHRQIAWLARDYAVSVLPAVSSLRAFRQSPAPAPTTAGLLGIGNPVVGKSAAGIRLATLAPVRDLGAGPELSAVPEAADELRAVARALGASEKDLLLGERATADLLRQIPLASYQTIAFATPALISGEVEGSSEPALVLTSAVDDRSDDGGLLTASKIAALKLNAKLVILSASNTAADGSRTAEGVSVMARAFFYAGARSLLVSHWRPPSAGCVHLMIETLAQLTRDPSITPAEVLRRVMMGMLDAHRPPEFSHPAVWGAFVLVGDGGAVQ